MDSVKKEEMYNGHVSKKEKKRLKQLAALSDDDGKKGRKN